jgi:hypothetical protein
MTDLGGPSTTSLLLRLSQRNECAGRRGTNLPDRLASLRADSGKRGESKTFKPRKRARLLAADGDLDNFVNVSDVDAVTGRFFPVDFDLEIASR